MDCKKVKRELSAYLDSELSYKEKQIVQEHLKDCINCKEEFNLLSGQNELLTKIETIEVSNDFRFNFWQRVRSTEDVPLRNIQKITVPVMRWIPVPVFCSIIILVFLTFSILTSVLYSNDMKTNKEIFVLVKKTFVPSIGQRIFSPLNFVSFCDECCQILCKHCNQCQYCKKK